MEIEIVKEKKEYKLPNDYDNVMTEDDKMYHINRDTKYIISAGLPPKDIGSVGDIDLRNFNKVMITITLLFFIIFIPTVVLLSLLHVRMIFGNGLFLIPIWLTAIYKLKRIWNK